MKKTTERRSARSAESETETLGNASGENRETAGGRQAETPENVELSPGPPADCKSAAHQELRSGPEAVVLRDGTRVVLSQVQSYRPEGREIEFKQEGRQVRTSFDSMEARDAALRGLDEIFNARPL